MAKRAYMANGTLTSPSSFFFCNSFFLAFSSAMRASIAARVSLVNGRKTLRSSSFRDSDSSLIFYAPLPHDRRCPRAALASTPKRSWFRKRQRPVPERPISLGGSTPVSRTKPPLHRFRPRRTSVLHVQYPRQPVKHASDSRLSSKYSIGLSDLAEVAKLRFCVKR